MIYRELGKTGLRVSRLCFGTLTIGPGQKNLDVSRGSYLISYALELGINFFDTAELYQTYQYLRPVIKNKRGEMIIASKSYAATAGEMRKSLQKCLQELNVEFIDVFLMHEQESEFTLRGHWEAWLELCRAKKEGIVRAIGISTHSPQGVRAGAKIPELDVIHPLVNKAGIGIIDGNLQDMLDAISEAAGSGKGIYAMKALAGGHLFRVAGEALKFVLDIPGVDSVAVGMQSEAEINYNAAIVSGTAPPEKLILPETVRKLHIEDWCQGCNDCVAKCPRQALALVNGKVALVGECILCGYCALVCRNFCLKVL
mgnify:CR=1 FL=1